MEGDLPKAFRGTGLPVWTSTNLGSRCHSVKAVPSCAESVAFSRKPLLSRPRGADSMDSHISLSSDELNPRSRSALASANIVRPASNLRVSDGLRFFWFVTSEILLPKTGLGESAVFVASAGRGRERLWGDSNYDLNRTCSGFSWVACKSIPDSLQENRRFLCCSVEDSCVG